MSGGKDDNPFENPTVQSGLAQYVAGAGIGSAIPRPAETAPAEIEKPILLAKNEPTATESRATKMVDAERARAERERIATIQRGLQFETRNRNPGIGIRALLGVLGGGRGGFLGSG